jgi:2,4-dienoyl-CoA reductase-like NADH-dependent reductase (Old Yellow Enzyme family)
MALATFTERILERARPLSLLVAGDLHLANRIVMAPLTRSRAAADGAPTDTMAEHYAQRASVGLSIRPRPGTRPSP